MIVDNEYLLDNDDSDNECILDDDNDSDYEEDENIYNSILNNLSVSSMKKIVQLLKILIIVEKEEIL